MRLLFAAGALLACCPAMAAPPPPPPPEVIAVEKDFFDALPQILPGEHSASLKSMIADDLVVTIEGEVQFETRDDWIAWRESLTDGRVERYQMLREKFWRDAAGRVVVEEFWYPFAKDIIWHATRPKRLVAYTFEDGKLTRVDTILSLDSIHYLNPKD